MPACLLRLHLPVCLHCIPCCAGTSVAFGHGRCSVVMSQLVFLALDLGPA